MKKVLQLLLMILLPALSIAQNQEEAVLRAEIQTALNELKASGEMTVLIKYVDWVKAFEKLPENAKRYLKIHSPEDYRNYTRMKWTAAEKHIRVRVQAFLAALPADQRAEREARLLPALPELIEHQRSLIEARKGYWKALPIELARVKIKQESALIEFHVGQEKRVEVAELTKKNGKWKLQGLEILEGSPARLDPTSPEYTF